MTSHEVVKTLVTALHTNIDSIHATLQSLSSHPTHEAELQRLASEREAKIFDLRTAHAQALQVLANQRLKEQDELEAQRNKEAEELEEQRKKEWEEILRKREREDEERRQRIREEEVEREKAKQEEDECREAEREERELKLAEDIEKELERVEDEIEAKVEEGKKALRELDEKRRAINAEIDKALNLPTVIPKIQYRSRTRTLSRAGLMEQGNLHENVVGTSALPAENKEVKTPEPGAWLGKEASNVDFAGTGDLVDPSTTTEEDESVSKPKGAIVDAHVEEDQTRDLADISLPNSPKSIEKPAMPTTLSITPDPDGNPRDLPNRHSEVKSPWRNPFQEPDGTWNENLSTETPAVGQNRELSSESKPENDIDSAFNPEILKDDLLSKASSHEVIQESLQSPNLVKGEDIPPFPEDELSEGTLVDEQSQSRTDSYPALSKSKDVDSSVDLFISSPKSDNPSDTPHQSIENGILTDLKNESFGSISSDEKIAGGEAKHDPSESDSSLKNTPKDARDFVQKSPALVEEAEVPSNDQLTVNGSLDALPQTESPSSLIEQWAIDNSTTLALASGERAFTGTRDGEGPEENEIRDELHDNTEIPMKLEEGREQTEGTSFSDVEKEGNETQKNGSVATRESGVMGSPVTQLEEENQRSLSPLADAELSVVESPSIRLDNSQNRDSEEDSGIHDNNSQDQSQQSLSQSQSIAVEEQNSHIEDEKILLNGHEDTVPDPENDKTPKSHGTDSVGQKSTATKEHSTPLIAHVEDNLSVEHERSIEQAPIADHSIRDDGTGFPDTDSGSLNNNSAPEQPMLSHKDELRKTEDARLESDSLEKHGPTTLLTEFDDADTEPEHLHRSEQVELSSNLEDSSLKSSTAEIVHNEGQQKAPDSPSNENHGSESRKPSDDLHENGTALEVLPSMVLVDGIVSKSENRETVHRPETEENVFKDVYPELQIGNLDETANNVPSPTRSTDNNEEKGDDISSMTYQIEESIAQVNNPDSPGGTSPIDEEQSKSLDGSADVPIKDSDTGDSVSQLANPSVDPSDNEVELLDPASDVKSFEVAVPVPADRDSAFEPSDEPAATTTQERMLMTGFDAEAPETLDTQSLEDQRKPEHDGKITSPSDNKYLDISSTHDQDEIIDTLPQQDTSTKVERVGYAKPGDVEPALGQSKEEVSDEGSGEEKATQDTDGDDNWPKASSTKDDKSPRPTETNSEEAAASESNEQAFDHIEQSEGHMDNGAVLKQPTDDEASGEQLIAHLPTSLDVAEDKSKLDISEDSSEAITSKDISKSLDSPVMDFVQGDLPAVSRNVDDVERSHLPVDASKSEILKDHLSSPLSNHTPMSGSAAESTQMTPVASSENLIGKELESQEMMLPANDTSEDQKDSQAPVDDEPKEGTLDNISKVPEDPSLMTIVNDVQDLHESILSNGNTELHTDQPSEIPSGSPQSQVHRIEHGIAEDLIKSQDLPSADVEASLVPKSHDLIIVPDDNSRPTRSIEELENQSIEDYKSASSELDDNEETRIPETDSNPLSAQEHAVSSTRDNALQSIETENHRHNFDQHVKDNPWELRDVANGADIHGDTHLALEGPPESSHNWSQSDDKDQDEESDAEQPFGSLRPKPVHRMTNEDEYLPTSARKASAASNDSEDMSFEERYAVPRPTTPITSLSGIDNHLESPHTVQDADDLFDDDDSEEDSNSERDPRENLADQNFQIAETPLEIVPEHGALTEFNDTYSSHRSSGLFANFVDAVRSDIPAVRQAQLDNYQPAVEYSLENSTRPRAVSFEDDEPKYAQIDSPRYESSLHVRTHTADTVPSFESYAQSDSIPTTPSDTSSSPFVDSLSHNEPMIRDSGRERGMTESSQMTHDLTTEPTKEPALDPSLVSAYPSFVSPKDSYADLSEHTQSKSSTSNGPIGVQTGLETHRAEISPIQGTESSPFATPGNLDTAKSPTTASSNPFKTSSINQNSPMYDSNKTPTTEIPLEATKNLPRAPSRPSLNSQSSPSPVPQSPSSSPSPSVSKPPPPQYPRVVPEVSSPEHAQSSN
ncbi:hypothetical protein BKA65DRAFT_576001 [Rhexocercosporidium sp. MPI-PUGE-AT-0058]|nr:hypothetical protein BKA65DRAFT_576001 [Rhexocercosporidium sp. MPI-PUGE-AT-0058]